jgi:hypothetical protein
MQETARQRGSAEELQNWKRQQVINAANEKRRDRNRRKRASRKLRGVK